MWWHAIPAAYKVVLFSALLTFCAYVGKKMFLERPKLRGKIISKLVTSRLGPADTELFVAEIMLRVCIVNKRSFPTTIQNWSVEAVHEGKAFLSQTFSPEGGRFAGRPLSADVKMLESYCAANRLEYGAAVEGVLFFEFSGIGKDVEKHTKVVLTVTDSFGKTHKIARGNLEDFPRG